MNQSKNTKLLVIIGYGLMVGLAIFGIIWIYSELVRFLDASEQPKQRNEFVMLSNTLAKMYQAEGTGGLLAIATNPELYSDYNLQMENVFQQIDSLQSISQDEYLNEQMDSLNMFLLKKQQNTSAMVELMKSYETNTIREITSTSVLSKYNTDKLDSLLVHSTQQSQDTSMMVGEKKKFLQRLGEAFRPSQGDTIRQISVSSAKSIQALELAALKDTIIDFIQEVNEISLKKNAILFSQIMKKQNQLYQINDSTTAKINQIMRDLEEKEQANILQLMMMRTQTLERSSFIVSIIALVAIIVAIVFMSWILHSISINQRLHREIEASKNKVEQLLLSREQLIFSITHDIKAPISSIIGYLELMIKDKPTSKGTYYIENMQQSSSHILDLVRNLLDLYSFDVNQQRIDKLPFYPFVLLRDIYDSFIPVANKKGVQLECAIDIDKNENYLSDPYRIRQIVGNILSNAVKFTPQGGLVSLSASLVKKQMQTSLQLAIKDTGSGIKEEDKERIFDAFERLDYSGTEIEGTGLGLSISHKLIQFLKGNITVHSTFGEGSAFNITIPLAPISIEKVTEQEPPPSETRGKAMRMTMGQQIIRLNKKRLKILFIDDDAIQLNLYSELLKQEKMTAYTCSGSLEALRLLQKERFDIIFSDIQMPDMNGFELVERIRMSNIEEVREVPIVGLSANSHLDEAKYKEAGFYEFLPKPFTPNQLFNIIYRYTGKENKKVNTSPTKGKGFDALIEFAGGDLTAAESIMRSFIEENKKNQGILSDAFDHEDWETVKKISHKMLPLMRMISARRIVSFLQDYENGSKSTEHRLSLLNSIKQKVKDAENYLEQYTMVEL